MKKLFVTYDDGSKTTYTMKNSVDHMQYAPKNEVKTRLVKSKCMADMLVWLGFEYKKSDDGYLFERSRMFDSAWRDIHSLRQFYRKINE